MTSENIILSTTKDLLSRVGLDVCLSVKKTHSEKNFLFVEQIKNGFCLSYNNKFFMYSPAIRRAFLLHECFHIYQYLENFPMLLSSREKGNIFLVQNAIADLYVSKNMREAGFDKDAKQIFSIQMKNVKKLLQSKSVIEKILRLSLLLTEASFFESKYGQIFNIINKKLTLKELEIIENVSRIMHTNYIYNNIFSMYEEIIHLLFPKFSINPFDNMIIVQEKKCLK